MRERDRALPYIRSYLTLGDYVGKWLQNKGESYSPTAFVPMLLRQHQRDHLLAELAFLNHALARPDMRRRLVAEYRLRLPAPARTDFDRLIGAERVFLGSQAILRAMRAVILDGTDEPDGTWGQQPIDTAVWLAQAVAEDLGHAFAESAGPELLPDIRGAIAMELIQNYTFHSQEDPWQRLTRYSVLWGAHGAAAGRTSLRAAPDDLFREATGVERIDLFAVAFGLWSLANDWTPGRPYRFDLEGALKMPKETTRRCIELLALDMSGFENALRDQAGDWQMLPFEEHPVLLLADGSVVVLDESLLLDRVSSGLYWYVLNHELGRDEKAASTWSTAFGAMVEEYAEARIQTLGPKGAFYTEEQIKASYAGRQADALLDLGAFLFVEVQKGQVSIPTRQEGAIDRFVADTDRLVLNKAAQLQDAALKVLDDETPLTGKSQRAEPVGRPIVIAGGGYPVNPITSEYITFTAHKRGLFHDKRFLELCVLDLGEIEMLEAVYSRTGRSALDVLAEWKAGGGHRYSLRTHLLEQQAGDPDQYRPKWMVEAGNRLFDDVEQRVAHIKEEDLKIALEDGD